MASQERRTAQRFKIELPVIVRWTNGSVVGEARTQSRDVCSRGIYFFLPTEVQNGSMIEILLVLPHEVTLAGPIKVRCLGRVQRIEAKAHGGTGVAVQIEQYEFLLRDGYAA